MLEGKLAPWIELSIGTLAPSDPLRPIRRALRFAALAAAMFLALFSAAMFLRAQRYRALAAQCYALQESVFRRALPGQSVPAGVLSRLRSEYDKLTVAKGDSLAVPEGCSALAALHKLLAGLPAGTRHVRGIWAASAADSTRRDISLADCACSRPMTNAG